MVGTTRGRHVAAVVAVLALVGVAACSSSGQSGTPAPSKGGGTVTIRLPTDWGVPIDGGQTVTSANGEELSKAMYDRLVTFDFKTGAVVPYLAKSWKVTPEAVTFKLRTDATCSDGTPVTPKVVADSIARLIAPATRSRWPVTIFGPGPYSVTSDDSAGTVTFSVGTPYNLLLQAFSWGWTGIICPAGLQPTADFTKQSYGSGPYVFESAVQGVEYRMKKRTGWNWGPTPSASMPDELVFKVVTNETTAANLLLQGGLDIADVTGPDTTRLSSSTSLALFTAHNYAPQTFQFNEDPARPTADIKVRQAIVTAVGAGSNAQAYNQAANQGTGVLSTNMQSNPGGFCYTDLSSLIPKPSISAARQVLEGDGYTMGSDGKYQKNGKDLSLTVLGVPVLEGSGPEYIASQLTQMGANVTLNDVDLNTFAQNFAKTNYDAIVGAFGSPVPIPATTANFFSGKTPAQGGNNRVNRVDPQMDTLVQQAFGAAPDQACAAWKAFNTYLLKNYISVPMPAISEDWYSAKSARWGYVAFATGALDPATIHRL